MKKVRIKSAYPIYMAAAVWLVIGLIRPSALLQILSILQTTVVSVTVYLIASKVFPGKVVEVREQADSGDAEVDRQIEEGRSQLERLQSYNDALPDPIVSEKLDRVTRAGNAILSELEKSPSRVGEVRRFMNYFLPMAEKLMASYVAFEQAPVKGDNVLNAMKSVENSLSMVAEAFEKQYDSLYRNKAFDIEADVSVLETLLKSEGLVEDGNIPNLKKTSKLSD